MDKDLYELKLHEEMIIDGETSVMRVPGGWIYTFRLYTATSVFVPLATYSGD